MNENLVHFRDMWDFCNKVMQMIATPQGVSVAEETINPISPQREIDSMV